MRICRRIKQFIFLLPINSGETKSTPSMQFRRKGFLLLVEAALLTVLLAAITIGIVNVDNAQYGSSSTASNFDDAGIVAGRIAEQLYSTPFNKLVDVKKASIPFDDNKLYRNFRYSLSAGAEIVDKSTGVTSRSVTITVFRNSAPLRSVVVPLSSYVFEIPAKLLVPMGKALEIVPNGWRNFNEAASEGRTLMMAERYDKEHYYEPGKTGGTCWHIMNEEELPDHVESTIVKITTPPKGTTGHAHNDKLSFAAPMKDGAYKGDVYYGILGEYIGENERYETLPPYAVLQYIIKY